MKTVFAILVLGVALTSGQFLPKLPSLPTLGGLEDLVSNLVTIPMDKLQNMAPLDMLNKIRTNCKGGASDFIQSLKDGDILANIKANIGREAERLTDGFKTGLTCMSAISWDDLKSTLKTQPNQEAINRPAPVPERKRRQTTTLPASVDWRTKGYVTPVANQGSCGSCWTFSANGAIEGAVFKKTGKLPNLSEQNLVDCVTASAGCNGGWMTDAYDYSIKNLGQNNETAYPYIAKQNTACKNVATANTGKVASYAYTNQDDEADLKAKLATVGPIAVAIDATYIQNYVSGVYTCTNFTDVNHGVLAVGYGTDTTTTPPKDYYIVKNSWGTGWGEQGYIRIIRNKGAAASCGLTTYANYPVA